MMRRMLLFAVCLSLAFSASNTSVFSTPMLLTDSTGVIASNVVAIRFNRIYPAGSKIVRITATRETGKMMAGDMDAQILERVDWIPPQYNLDSKRACDIVAGAPPTIEFHWP
jgi:hypothetical protein